MYVKIGKYETFNSAFGVLSKLEDKGYISEKTSERISDFFDPAFKIWNKRPWNKRKVVVRIDDYDVWSLHETLSHIILPMLIKLKENKQGAPHVDEEDVPEALREKMAKPKENENDVDEFWFDRFDYVLDEMIWAFGQDTIDWESQFHHGELKYETKDVPGSTNKEMIFDDTNYKYDQEGHDKHYARMTNGFKLFGKYYHSLWD